MTWGRFIIDAVFRGGKKHSNHGDTAAKMVEHIVKRIRKKYRQNVAIIIKSDSGFFDQKLFRVFEGLGIGYICSGKIYDDIKDYILDVDQSSKEGSSTGWGHYRNKEQAWDYVDFMDQRDTWTESRRAIYCRPVYEGQQQLLDFGKKPV